MKEGPWLKQAQEKGLVTHSLATPSSALAAGDRGGVGVSLDVIPDGIDEATWQEIVVGYAKARGWKVAHCRKTLVKMGKKQKYLTSMPAGWFDLVLVRPPIIRWVELKVKPNAQTDEQADWAIMVIQCGEQFHLWYPENWQEVQDTLR